MSLEEVRAGLPDAVHAVLANCDSLIVHALHPEQEATPGKSFLGYFVSHSVAVEDTRERRKVVVALYQDMAMDSPTAFRDYCFIPHHGVHASVGSTSVDLVLSYQCGNVRVHTETLRHGYLFGGRADLSHFYISWPLCCSSRWLLDDLLEPPAST